MQDEILDYFQEERKKGRKIIQIKTFYFSTEAGVFAARFKDEGIPCFVSHANTVSVMPMGDGGVGLHIFEDHKSRALQLIKEMEQNLQNDPDEDFREADLDDIEFERRLNENRQTVAPWTYKLAIGLVVALMILALLRQVFIAAGYN